MGERKNKSKKRWQDREIKNPATLAKVIDDRASSSHHRSLDGAPENLDMARMLPHLRTRPFSQRPPWVERRALQLGES